MRSSTSSRHRRPVSTASRLTDRHGHRGARARSTVLAPRVMRPSGKTSFHTSNMQRRVMAECCVGGSRFGCCVTTLTRVMQRWLLGDYSGQQEFDRKICRKIGLLAPLSLRRYWQRSVFRTHMQVVLPPVNALRQATRMARSLDTVQELRSNSALASVVPCQDVRRRVVRSDARFSRNTVNIAHSEDTITARGG
jgi:hypothetical protein